MKSLILAIQFLTRIPINVNVDTEKHSFGDSVLWFPFAGVLIGAFNALIYWSSSLLLGGIFPAVCAVLANICITGALHVDGLADTCDGIFSSRKKDRMLEIMRDSRIGTNGAIAIAFDILLRIAILSSIMNNRIIWLVFCVPMASKSLLPFVMRISRYARTEGGMGGLFLGKQSWRRTIAALITGVAGTFATLSHIGLISFSMAFLAVVLFRNYIYTKIQGMTGDTFGAANEIIELVFMLTTAIIWRQLA